MFGPSYALINANRLDYYHQLERERIRLLLIDEAGKVVNDISAGCMQDARETIQRLKTRRCA